jgi:Na+-driven multidrug efflux pump
MTDTPSIGDKAAGTAAVTASVAALACGVCCVLPFALPAALLGMFGGTFAVLDRAYPWMRWAAVLAALIGWAWVIVQSARSRRRPAKSTLVVMAVASLTMIVALTMPCWKGH